MNEQIQKKINTWLDGPYDEETKNEIRSLLKSAPEKLVDAFYTNLSFGTGGMRGIVGVGTNRINRYTIAACTQGFANFLKKRGKAGGVVIGFDSRTHSQELAEIAAETLAANGIRVFLFKALRPTPLISFAVRQLKGAGGIMITASHNPPEYNGYKVYGEDGGQVLSPFDKEIVDEVNRISGPEAVKTTNRNNPLITLIGDDIDTAYLKAMKTLELYKEDNQSDGSTLSIVYTSLHGTGITLVPRLLNAFGFTNLHLVDKQCIPDGTFPTVSYPNPEEREALSLGVQKLQQSGGDLLLATDPDADRVGVAVRHENSVHYMTGNQLACVLLEHVCRGFEREGGLPENGAFVKTIATTELFSEIAAFWKRPCFNTLTGFKYIAGLIREWESTPGGKRFLFGGEESYGYLLGTYARDKDAIIISALIAEAALQLKLRGKTLIDALHDLYKRHGLFYEELISLKFPETEAGRKKMGATMERWKKSPPEAIGGILVERLEDFETSTVLTLKKKTTSPLPFPKSDALLFWLEDGSKVLVRPSGTEPKVKLYIGIKEKGFEALEDGLEAAKRKAKLFADSMTG